MPDTTNDGREIVKGLRVVTNNLDWGTVEEVGGAGDGWHWIRLDSGGRDMMNGERLTCRHPFGDRDPRAVPTQVRQGTWG